MQGNLKSHMCMIGKHVRILLIMSSENLRNILRNHQRADFDLLTYKMCDF